MHVDKQSKVRKSATLQLTMRSPKCVIAYLLCMFMFVLVAPDLLAQSETGKATLEGRILDQNGAAVSGATVTIVGTSTGWRRAITTDSDGKFRFASLEVGVYTVEATASGFGTAHTNSIDLPVGQTKSINISLSVAAVNTEIVVQSNSEIVNVADTNNSVVIDQRAIEHLPIRGRNFTEFMQLTPNVMQEQNRFGIVVNGQRSINSNISLDGMDFNDPVQGGQRGGGLNQSAYFFPQLAIREFQVVRDGVSAEVGRTNSGYVNVVTKSGTNEFHGEAFYMNRNPWLTSTDAFGNSNASNKQHQIGGSFGGPIKKDKLFFFGAVEKNLINVPYTVKFNTPSGNVTVPQDLLDQQGTFDQKNNPLVVFARLDYILNAKNTLNVQYTYAAQYGLNFGGVSGQTNAASTNNTILDRASQGVKSSFTTVFSANLINEVRGQYVYDDRIQKPNSTAAEVDINDFGTIGGNKDGTFIYDATRIEMLDNVTWTHGNHTMRFGGDVNFSPGVQQRETNYGGVYSFKTLSDYLAALAGDNTKINRYQQSIASNGTQGLYEGTQKEVAAFLTDTIKVRRDLTVTAGLRWDGQINPQAPVPSPTHPNLSHIPNDLTMWQPRLGFAWDIGGKGTTVIRLSAGIFDARTPSYLMQRAFTDNGVNTLILDTNVDASILPLIKVPNIITAIPQGVKTPINSLFGFDQNFRNPRSGQVAFALERQLDRDTKITIGFVRNSTWALQRRIDTNLFPPTILPNGLPVYPAFDSKGVLVQASGFNAATGQPIFIDTGTGKAFTPKVARPDPTLGQINLNESIGHSSYNGYTVSVQRRLSRRLEFGLNYTHSFNRDDDSNERDFNRQTALDTFNFNFDAAWSKNDIRNSFNVNALYDLGHGFTVSTLVFARSGYPVKAVVGADTQNDGNTVNDRPIINGVVVGRSAFLQPSFFDWDLRLLKEFKLGETKRLVLSIEGFNLTKATNKQFNGDGETTFGAPQATTNPNTGLPFTNNTALVPTFAPGTDRWGGPRQGQLGVRFIF